MNKKAITPDLMVADILTEWPETVQIFLAYRMSCIGCYLSPFDSLEDALVVHDLPVEAFVDELNQKIKESGSGMPRDVNSS
jgi:hybrid cluster-associated redox disulfide protein